MILQDPARVFKYNIRLVTFEPVSYTHLVGRSAAAVLAVTTAGYVRTRVARVRTGQVVLADVCGTGVDLSLIHI